MKTEKHRKADQEYIDAYDRTTIKTLKELEKNSTDLIHYRKDLENIPGSKKTASWIWDDPTTKYNIASDFFNTAVMRAQNKESSILLSKRADENKDRLVMENPVPRNIRCNTCNSEMNYDGPIFKEDDTLILFVFTCPNKHPPRKAIYPDGQREWAFKKSTCKKCGGDFESKSEEKGKLLVFTDTCISCGEISITEFELPEPDHPIDEVERKKYCTDWRSKKTFIQGMEEIFEFSQFLERSQEEKKVKEDFDVDKIERVNVPKLEVRLAKIAEGSGFVKFKFDNTSTRGFVIVSFSAQDPSDRKEKESIKELTSIVKKALFLTNWRLMSDEINYRLGVLSGRIKAFEDDEGLLKIAKEIFENETL